VQVDTVRITLIQNSKYGGFGTWFLKQTALGFDRFAAKLTSLVVNMCVVADVKFQENPQYAGPDSGEGKVL
jgi:hypothetical protein